MDYIPRFVKSKPGLSQERALRSLQDHKDFVDGTKIAGIRREGQVWVAKILEPVTAAEDDLPSDDDVEIGPPPSEDKPEPPKPEPSEDEEKVEEGKEHENKEEGKLNHIEGLLKKIVDALGIDDGEDGGLPKGPPDDLSMDMGPGPGGPPGGPADRLPKKEKLKPGDVPPGVTPIGAPSFSSVQKQTSTLFASAEGILPIKQAREELDNLHAPYKVKEIKHQNGNTYALLSLRP